MNPELGRWRPEDQWFNTINYILSSKPAWDTQRPVGSTAIETNINFALRPVKDSKHLMLKTLESSPVEVRPQSEGDLRSLLASQARSTLGASDRSLLLPFEIGSCYVTLASPVTSV